MTRRGDILVLAYHEVGDVDTGAFVTPADLDWQLRLLAGRGYGPATFTDAVLSDARRRLLAVTFDDGHASVLDEALPVLERHGLLGTVFPRLDLLGSPGLLSQPGLETLVAAGWEVGSHTLTHRNLTTLDDAELERELVGSKRELEALLGRPCRSIAYPRGDADERVLAAAAGAGYETAAALYGVPVPQGRLAWPRVGVHGSEGGMLFRARISGPVRALRTSEHGSWLARSTARVAYSVEARISRRSQR